MQELRELFRELKNPWLAFALCLMIVLIVILFSIRPGFTHDHGRPDLNNWFMSLQSKGKVSCCDGSDAMRLDDVDWDAKDGHYRVRLQGEWVDVPDSAVVEGPNRAGPTMVWPYYLNGSMRGVRCFMPGSMT